MSSVQPHYVRPKKLNNNVKMVFKPDEIVVTSKNVESRAQKRLSDRHHQVDSENNTIPNQPRPIRSQTQNQQQPLRDVSQNSARNPQLYARTILQKDNKNAMRYELMPGVKNLHALQQQQVHDDQPQQGRSRQPPGYKSVSDRLHQGRQQEPVWKPGSGRLDHLITGRQTIMDPASLEQDPALQNQVTDEYGERPRRRHPAGSSFIRAQDSPEPITGYTQQRAGYTGTGAGGANTINQRPGFSGGAQSRLSKDKTSVNRTGETEFMSVDKGLSYQPLKPQAKITVGRPLVSGSGEQVNQNWYKKASSYNYGQNNLHDKEESKFENMVMKPTGDLRAKPTGDLRAKPTVDLRAKPTVDLRANLNKIRNITEDLDPEMERFQSLKIQDNDAVNYNQVAFKTTPDPKKCICMRKLKIILCQGCLHSEFGRIRKQCSEHPEDQYLMDTTICGSCRKSDLKEYDIPANIDVSKIINKRASKKNPMCA